MTLKRNLRRAERRTKERSAIGAGVATGTTTNIVHRAITTTTTETTATSDRDTTERHRKSVHGGRGKKEMTKMIGRDGSTRSPRQVTRKID
jgi:hypothetical protein